MADAAAEALVAAVGRSLDAIRTALNVAEANESPDVGDVSDDAEDERPEGDVEEEPGEEDVDAPSIICTSLIGSKGLSAGHAFIVGFNDGHLPRDFRAISDDEVCQFLVGLSRTRKACHVISVGNYGGNWLEPSAFAEWIESHLAPLKVDKKYLERFEASRPRFLGGAGWGQFAHSARPWSSRCRVERTPP